jgi:hypothetical protein
LANSTQYRGLSASNRSDEERIASDRSEKALESVEVAEEIVRAVSAAGVMRPTIPNLLKFLEPVPRLTREIGRVGNFKIVCVEHSKKRCEVEAIQ